MNSRRRSIAARIATGAAAGLLTVAAPTVVHGQTEAGIPVTDPVVVARCGGCHSVDDRGNMQRISWARATPEGWQAATKRMIAENGVSVTPVEARAIVKYLSTRHGLAPGEASPVMYSAERRIRDESATVNEVLLEACGKCHQAARALSWRRAAGDWKHFVDRHAARYQFTPAREAIGALTEAAALHTREWDAWTARTRTPDLGGRWLVTAHLAGRGTFHGEMDVEATGPDEFLTRTRLRSADATSVLARTGRGLAYAGTAWRGRSTGTSVASATPDDPSNETQEVMLVAPDGSSVEGRWFWGQYQELGFDVTMRRPSSSEPTLLLVDPVAFKAGSSANRLRLVGDRFPSQVTAADVSVGPGVTVRRIVSATPGEIVAEVDVAREARPGRRAIAFRSSTLERAVAIYDRVDYLKVLPDSSLAAFGSRNYLRGYQQFEAVGYDRGPDGKRQTADDVELGPVEVSWSMEVFYEIDRDQQDRVGTLSQAGFFTPAATSPGVNSDVWIIATAKHEKSADGKPLVGKSYLVVTVPTYTFNGRTFVRDLDRWIEEGSNPR